MPHHDHPQHADGPETIDAIAHSLDDPWPADPLPTLEQDLSVVAWLQGSTQLSSATTGYLCDVLLAWALLGGEWPDPVEPVAGPDCDHLEALVQMVDRWRRRAMAEPIGRRLDLAHVGRGLATAVVCQRDPDALAESQWRETLHRQPWLAGPPAPCRLADGHVL